MAETLIHVPQKDFYDFSLTLVVLKVQEILSQKFRLKIILAGGKTPLPLYERLAQIEFPWERFEFFMSDERLVPLDSNESNYKNIAQSFFSKIEIPAENVHFFRTDLGPEEALKLYLQDLKNCSEGFDLAILGMGEDGHVASIFEIEPPVWKEDVLIVPPAGTPKVARISLTLKTLNETDYVFFMIAGEEKKKRLHEAFDGKNFPAALVNGRKETIWLISDD